MMEPGARKAKGPGRSATFVDEEDLPRIWADERAHPPGGG